MRVTRSFALAVVTGAAVFGSAGVAGAGQDAGHPRGDGGVIVRGLDDLGPVDPGEGPGEPAGGKGDRGDGDDDRGGGKGGHERRGGDNDRPLCEDERMHRGELAVDPDRSRRGQVFDRETADWDLGDGGPGGTQGWFNHWKHCVETPPAPENPGQPPKSEPDADVHADPDRGGTGDDGAESEAGPGTEHTAQPESSVDGAPAEPPGQPTADRQPQDPAGEESEKHLPSSAAPAPSVQRADADSDAGSDDGAAAAGAGSDDGGMGFGGGLLLIGGGGLLAAAAAAVLAVRTRRA
ncbi:hypothetical protein FB384_002775 [Prauserella sediminis]|uniref:Uncharacterized protein n=1 Tax=Prauserella sediminis TaxID=577680 RepID=A0A839XM93_9PSEU|nr:hypothetical protein [Prauserella sediminis]MBB3663871.1 hypothetical protein [Prauserella sediminis]